MKTRTHSSSRKSLASRRRHGLSDSHAFAVGRATGVRINTSHAANVGAALHNSKKHREHARKMSRSSSGTKHSFSSSHFSESTPIDVLPSFDELKQSQNYKFFYLLLIPIIIFLIITFIVMVLSIATFI